MLGSYVTCDMLFVYWWVLIVRWLFILACHCWIFKGGGGGFEWPSFTHRSASYSPYLASKVSICRACPSFLTWACSRCHGCIVLVIWILPNWMCRHAVVIISCFFFKKKKYLHVVVPHVRTGPGLLSRRKEPPQCSFQHVAKADWREVMHSDPARLNRHREQLQKRGLMKWKRFSLELIGRSG